MFVYYSNYTSQNMPSSSLPTCKTGLLVELSEFRLLLHVTIRQTNFQLYRFKRFVSLWTKSRRSNFLRFGWWLLAAISTTGL